MLSLPALRLLAALEEHQTLDRAATHVDLSQSAASHTIEMLEKRLDATLVVRCPGGLRLSETGRRLLPHIRQITGSLEAIRDEVSGLASLARGTLRIAAVPSLASTFVPRMIRQFHEAYPPIDVSLFEGTDDEVAQWVRDRVADVRFAALPVDGLDGEEITRDEWLAVVPAADFEGRAQVSLRALSKRKFLLWVEAAAQVAPLSQIGLLTASATRQSPAVEAWSKIARGFFTPRSLKLKSS